MKNEKSAKELLKEVLNLKVPCDNCPSRGYCSIKNYTCQTFRDWACDVDLIYKSYSFPRKPDVPWSLSWPGDGYE